MAGTIVRRQFLRLAPLEFGPLAEDDFSGWADLARLGRRARTVGMRAAMDCSSGSSPARWERIQRERESSLLQGVTDFPSPEVCDSWGVPQLEDAFRQPHPGPVLFITASLDGLTPASNVDEMRPNFPPSGHVIVQGIGHEGPALWNAPGIIRLVGAFLQGAPPSDATLQAPPIDWQLPPDA